MKKHGKDSRKKNISLLALFFALYGKTRLRVTTWILLNEFIIFSKLYHFLVVANKLFESEYS